jgi:formylglycine-generating enzyme
MLRRMFPCFAAAALAALPPAAKAQVSNVFDMPAGQTSLSFVTVGDPGNVADSYTGYGAVAYTYQMGTYDVTLGQYTQFLNAVAATDQFGCYTNGGGGSSFGIAQTGVSGSYSYSVYGSNPQAANMPVNSVTWGDAARFVNWLDNGQPTGGETLNTTESGAYYLNGATSKPALNAVASPPHSGSGAPAYFLPSENEWYKAAYYAGGGTNAGYWSYPTQADIGLDNSLALAATQSNEANYYNGSSYTDPVNSLTPVGTFVLSPGPYGTYDMGGDVAQWNEAIVATNQRGARGGDWHDVSSHILSTYRVGVTDTSPDPFVGFRVASIGAVHWAAAAGGSWATAGNWLPNSVPNAQGALAQVNAPTTSPITITLDGPQTVGSLLLGNSANSATGYTLSAGSAGTLTLDNGVSVATITVTDGSHAISAPVILASGLLVTPSASATLTISGNLSETAPSALTLSGPGTLVLSGSGSYSGGTIVDAGTLVVDSASSLPDGSSLTVGQDASSIFTPIAGPAPAAEASPVPEPGTIVLVIAGLVVGLRLMRGRKLI